MQNLRPILLVEDDDVDTMIVKRTFDELKVANQLVCRVNGKEGLEYLRNGDNRKPCLILLDLNMPKMNGIEFMKIVKADEVLRKIPIIVLTTSKDEQDRVESFKVGVGGYMLKPTSYKKFVDTVRTINLYWTLSELPNEE